MKGISAIFLCTGKVDCIQESLASFLGQSYAGPKEAILANTCFRQQLVFEHPEIVIGNAREMTMPMKARNGAIAIAKYDTIVLWDEHGYYLPCFLTQIATEMEGKNWVYFDKEYCFDGNHFNIERGSEFAFAFSIEAWKRCGQFGPGIASPSAKNLIGNITKAYPGQQTALAPDAINIIRIGTAEQRERAVPTIRSGKIDLIPNARMDYRMKLGQNRSGNRGKEICVVELGRYGDIIAILPFLQLVHETYKTPHLMVSAEFASLLEGVSYCKVVSVPLKNEQLGMAMSMAKKTFEIVIRGQIWGHGHTQVRMCESYNQESFREIGMLHRFDDKTFIPYFDRRDAAREEALKKSIFKTDKQKILVNVSRGTSSPCPQCVSLLAEIEKVWGDQCEVINLAEIQAHRLYDVLGLFEEAALLVSLDTSFIHLCTATNIPVIAILNSKPWAGTKVRGNNLVWSFDYEQAKTPDLRKLHESIAAALQRENKLIVHSPLKTPTKGRVFHLVDRFEDDPKSAARKFPAYNSWDALYESGELLPIHTWDYPRRSKATIGDTRDLPYVRDLFQQFLNQAKPGDICLWGNDDILLHKGIAEYCRMHCSVFGAVSFFRVELQSAPNSLDMLPEELARLGRGRHIGRDAFAFTYDEVLELVEECPDWILAAKMWDVHLALLIRLKYKIRTKSSADVAEQIFPAEAPRGYCCHIAHASAWTAGGTESIPSNKYNGKLFLDFYERAKNYMDIKVTPEGNLG